MHGSDENCITGARGTQVVNGNTTPGHGAPPAATQVSSSVVSSKVVYKAVSTPPPTPVNTASTSNSVATLCQQGTILNIMSRPGTVTAATPNGTPGAVQLQPGMQIVNVRQNQSTIQLPGGRGLPPRMIVNQIPNIRPGQPGQVTLQTFQGLPPGTQGHLIVKTDNGQLQLVRVNAAPVNPGQIPPNGTQANASTMLVHQTIGNAYRFQQPQPQSTITALTGSTGTTTASQVVNAGGQTVVVPASSIAVSATSTTMAGIMPATVTSTMANNIHGGSQQTTPAVGTQTISAESAKTKCKNFLATLLRLASEQRAKVAQNVRNLIQGLIDGKVEPEAFTEELQKDLNSSPQPCLVPFLKKTLPYLRASLARGELTIEGVRPPPLSAVGPVTGMTTVIPSMLGIAKPTAPTTTGPLRVVTPVQTGTFIQRPTATTTVGQQSAISSPRIVTQVQPLRVANKTLISSVRTHMPSSNTQFTNASNSSNSSVTTVSASQGLMNSVPFTSKASNSRPGSKDDKKKDKNVAFNSYSANVPDDDINDVAAMGGVNLGEESQRILDSTGFVGTQIRSCKDEVFLSSNPLLHRIRQITAEYDLEDPSKEVVALVSHAVQERLKTLVEKLGVIAEHRLDLLKTEPRYETIQDVKGQLRFLEDLDKLEKKRKDEQEREMLIRAAKSRSKSEDPEQAKLKAKAKEMQRVEMEEMRQRDANLTALKALQGPRKKPKLESLNEEGSSTFSGTFTQKQMPLRPRIKRVNLRDCLCLMEQEKDLNKSNLLYRTYLK